mmetsp:Transcript_13881/g.20245  ORF Transcript_13881/g.20245 Transcript_13881/m.20245 type:complete len:442 (+) Transcript_13881:123-1448(+)
MGIIFPKELQQKPPPLAADFLNPMLTTAGQTMEALTDKAMSGRIAPILSKFVISREKIAAIGQSIKIILHPVDIFVLFFFSLATVPIAHVLYTVYAFVISHYSGKRVLVSGSDKKEISTKINGSHGFRNSYAYQFAEHLSQVARIGLLVYLADCLSATADILGFHTDEYYMSHVFAKLLYTIWAARRFKYFKKHILYEYVVKIKPESEKKILHINHLLDGIIYAITFFKVGDLLSVEMGLAMTSVFAFGSVGTLVFSLAGKDIATQAVNGLALTISDRMSEGDVVKFGDGTSGKVMKIGWLETKLRTFDDLLVTIPNTQLGTQRVCNMSRIVMCRVRPTLHFRFSDADKVPRVLEDIQEEIKKSCPELITDGSRPFRAIWTDIKDDHLETFIDCHFHLPPIGKKYWNNRQKVMEAIDRVLKKNEIELFTAVYPKLELGKLR